MNNNEIIKKSIFRQKTYARRYFLAYEETISIFDKKRRREAIRNSCQDIVSDDEIFVCDLGMPFLKSGEEFFIEEKNMRVTIESSCRSSSGSITYYIQSKYIDDEETKTSFKEIRDYESLYNNYCKLKDKYNKAVSLIPFWNKKKLTK